MNSRFQQKFCVLLFTSITSLLLFINCTTGTDKVALQNNFPQLAIIDTTDKRLPYAVINFVKTALPRWQLVDTADYDNNWWSFYDRVQVPNFVVTDINDDQQADYGCLIKTKDSLRLVILQGTKGNGYIPLMADGFAVAYNPDSSHIQYGLAVEAPGQIDVIQPQEKSLVLKSNGITVMQYEVRHRVFYMENNKLNCFYTN